MALQLSPHETAQFPFPCAQSSEQRGAVAGHECAQPTPLGQRQTSGLGDASLHPRRSQPATDAASSAPSAATSIAKIPTPATFMATTLHHSLQRRKEAGYLGGVFRIMATRGTDEIVADAPLARLPALLKEPGTTVWVDLSSPSTEEDLYIVRDIFRFHQLAIEDCFESRAHPKVEELDSYIYTITHGLAGGSTAEDATVVELDAFIGRGYIVTHHNIPSRSVSAVAEAVLKTGLPLRRGSVEVLHALLDRQVDGLEETLDNIEERITHLEDAVFARPSNEHLASLLAVKRNILQLRRWMSKQREVVLRLGRREFAIVSVEEAMLFRDVHDHLVRINDLLESFREMATSIQDAYLSVTSNRLNETMKFLTLFTATLMPLTVISGIYGMNFHFMPELDSRIGYPVVLGVMAVAVMGVLLFFRRRGWLGRAPDMPPLQPLSPLAPPPRRTSQMSVIAVAPEPGENRAAMTAAEGPVPTVSTTPSRGRS